jgi:hypothetical protein
MPFAQQVGTFYKSEVSEDGQEVASNGKENSAPETVKTWQLLE